MHLLNFNLLSCFQFSRILFFFSSSFFFFFSFTESVLVLTSLEVDYSVARRNEPMMQFPYSVHVSPCACMTGKLLPSYLHPHTVIDLYTLTQGSILLPRSRSLPRLLMGLYQSSIIMKQKEITLELL